MDWQTKYLSYRRERERERARETDDAQTDRQTDEEGGERVGVLLCNLSFDTQSHLHQLICFTCCSSEYPHNRHVPTGTNLLSSVPTNLLLCKQ